MKRSIKTMFCYKVFLLAFVGMLFASAVNAASSELDDIFARIAEQNKGATLTISSSDDNPLDIKLSINIKNATVTEFVDELQDAVKQKAFINIALDDDIKKINNITIK